MAWDWAKTLVAPTGSSGLSSGNYTAVDEAPPWSDTDTTYIQLGSGASGTAIFNGFDLSLGPGDKKGFGIWVRSSNNAAEGFLVTITLKQDTTTLWTSSQYLQANSSQITRFIRVPDSAFSGNPDIDNLSVEFAVVNQRSGNQRLSFSWVAISKSPFTAAQEAELPSTLTGQEFVCYRASDLGVLGAADAESIVVLPDASGGGRHAILRVGTAPTYQTDAPEGVEASACRFVGALGFDTATEAAEEWGNNKVFHFALYPTSGATKAFFSISNASDFFAASSFAKHILGIEADVVNGGNDWIMMSGDGSGGAHKQGGDVQVNTEYRVTEWVQIGGSNEKLWEDNDASPLVNAESGSNPFGMWSLFDRETDDRSFVGRMQEVWFIEATGITEGDIDTARDEWIGSEAFSGGSVSGITVSAVGAGQTARSGGSVSPITVGNTGAGTTARSGGAVSPIAVSAIGGGTQGGQNGGSVASILVSALGAGSKAASGGSSASVLVTPSGDGFSSEDPPPPVTGRLMFFRSQGRAAGDRITPREDLRSEGWD